MRSAAGNSLACLLATTLLFSLLIAIAFIFFYSAGAVPSQPHSAATHSKDGSGGRTEGRRVEERTRKPGEAKEELVRPVKVWHLLSEHPVELPKLSPQELKSHHTGHYRGLTAQIWDPHPRYEFEGFGKKFRLDLTLSKPVAPNGIKVLHVWENTSRLEAPKLNTRGCFYTGHLHGDPHSKVSVSLCQGMRGHIWTSDGSYTIEPAEKWQGPAETMLHTLSKIPEIKHSCHHEEDEPIENHTLDDMESHDEPPPRRMKRSAYQEYTIELMVVADKKMVEFHGDDLHHYIINLIAAVDKIFKDPSIGNPMSVVLAKIVVLEFRQDWSGIGASEMLDKFCKYQHSMNVPDDSDPNHHDSAIFLTREKLCRPLKGCESIGLAEVGGICRDGSSYSCAIVKDMGLSTVFTIAHELGHILNLPHDNTSVGAKCHRFAKDMESKHLMSNVLSSETKLWLWSICSKTLLTEFLEDGHGNCLLDPPVKEIGEKYRIDYAVQPLGETFDLDRQCELVYGKGYMNCPRYHNICHELWCQNYTSETCSTLHGPWADGTPCGHGRWCQKRQCVLKEDLKPIDGGWSKWQRSGDCSRSCGGGVRTSVRECNNPIPVNGGRYCLGERVRYHSCNSQECPPGSIDFREQQCAKYNNDNFNLSGLSTTVKWVPKYDGISLEERCKLYCRNSENLQHYELKEKVTDGTVCGPNTFDICVNGQCRPAGCDHVLGSKTQLDYCGQCGGDNSTCIVITGTYNKTQYGYMSIVSIPTGASNLEVKQHGYLNSNKDNNYLALFDNETSQYILNGNYRVAGRKLILYGGTTLEYSGSDAVIERIRATRPLTRDINLQVFSIATLYPPDITYQYTVPKQSLYQYTWELSDEWSTCDKVCNGETWRVFKCVRAESWQEFSPELCAASMKGEEQRIQCNTHCTLSWQATGKSECSSDCGPGYRVISFECTIEENGMRSPTHDSACEHIPRPQDTEPCEGQCVEPKWVFLEWGECSRSCGTGRRKRIAHCMDTRKQRRNDNECNLSEKKTEEYCNTQECPTWQVGNWTECSATCGGGKRHRPFWCQYDGKQDNIERCPRPSPVITETCNNEPCPNWIEEEWSECSVTCGKGEESRYVYCSVPNACPNNSKPISTRPCYMPECTLGHANAIPGDSSNRFSWRQKWSECSVTCGKGETHSSFECYDNIADKGTDYRNCAGQIPPPYRKVEICYMPPCPRWIVGDWEPCSAICGSGTQSRRISCESHSGILLPDYACSMYGKPHREEKPCDINCPQRGHGMNEWIKLPWSPCSVSCGRGIMVRKVTCHGHCSGPMPPMSAPCNLGHCADEGNWTVSSWSECSATCGEGLQERQIRCESREGEVLPENYCSSPAPSRRQLCKAGPCKPVYKWEVTRWTPCSASCGKGSRRRRVECKSTRGEIVSAHHCTIVRKRPNDLKACKKAPCPFDWEEGEWSQCSSSCGHGVQTRKVRCLKNYYNGKVRKDIYEVEERFCNGKAKPEIRKTCKGYCNNGFRWEVGEWNPCNKPCSRKGKQKRNLYCYYGKKKVHLKYCPKELRPERRKKCDVEMCPSCRALQEGMNKKRDGEYQLWIQGRNVTIYCYNMQDSNPREYITLPYDNYAEIFSESLRHPSRCLSRGQRSDYCESDMRQGPYGFTHFKKIHINVTTLVVDSTDLTFATTVKGSPVNYGEAGDCQTRGLCPEGKFTINLLNTGFRVSPSTTWVGLGEQYTPPTIEFLQDRQKVTGRCGGCCGFCKPRNDLKLDLLPP